MAKSKKQKVVNSFEALGDLNKKDANNNSQEITQNFYSFLHKRDRFYTDDVILYESRRGKETPKDASHNKFEIKGINVDSLTISTVNGRDGDWKEEIKYTDISKNFVWQKTDFYQKLVTRHHNNAIQLTHGNILPKIYDKTKINELQFKPDWRLAIGLGSGSIFETSISLHHIYGFPYIPASAVKGVLRSYIITTLFGEEESENEPLLNAEFRAFQNKYFCKIFGCPDKFEEITFENGIPQLKKDGKYQTQKLDVNSEDEKNKGKAHVGDLIFFDTYPIHTPKDCIKADIMNPHYPDYYGNKNLPPADWQSPVPIIFLTVENLKFQFIIGLRKGVKNEHIELGEKNGDMLSVVSNLLQEALTQKGIGAKTAVGYGYMTENN